MGIGKAGTPQSIYNTSTRKAHEKAFKEALSDLNLQIMSDSLLLNSLKTKIVHP